MKNRFRETLPIIILFLIGSAIFSYSTKNILWFVASLAVTTLIFVLSRLGER